MGRPIHKEDAMGNEFTGFEDNAPTLTLEPDLGEPKAEIAAEPEAEAVKKEMEQTLISSLKVCYMTFIQKIFRRK